MSNFFTPKQPKNHERLFKTPMSFSPHRVGSQLRPSPSRIDLWKQELGLDDTQFDAGHMIESDSDEENRDPAGSGVTQKEVARLQTELVQRDAQRDELLFSLRTLTDRSQQYKRRLEAEEQRRRQQLRLLGKTHAAQLQEQQRIIRSLEAMLESEDNSHAGDAQLRPLVQQAEELGQRVAELTQRVLEQEAELSTAREEVDAAREASEQLTAENERIRGEMQMLQTPKLGQGAELATLELQLHKERVQPREEQQAQPSQELEEKNTELVQRLSQLEAESGQQERQLALAEQTEAELRAELKALRKENRTLGRELRQLRVELASVQVRSPEVVQKVRQVESEEMKAELKRLQGERENLTETLRQAEQHHMEEMQRAEVAREELQRQLERTEEEQVAALTGLQERTAALQTLVGEKDEEMMAQKERWEEELGLLREQLQREAASAQEDNQRQIQRLRHLCSRLPLSVAPELHSLHQDRVRLSEEVAMLQSAMRQMVNEAGRKVCCAIATVSEHNQTLVKRYQEEMRLRKKYHDELVELRGNIRVFCRIRPSIPEDGRGAGSSVVARADAEDDSKMRVLFKDREQTFDLDRVFPPQATQSEVFQEVESLVTSCIDGFNVCIFAYGQTGSGKTYTMQGPEYDPGINQRALQTLFSCTEERSDWTYTISVSFIEIYNETLRDLLSEQVSFKLEVKMTPEGGLHVPGLTQLQVTSLEDINQVYDFGLENRATASTRMNAHSSRSHALLCITVCGHNHLTGVSTEGRLSLVDLAGSERVSKSGADGTRLREAQSINRSLSCLGDVMHALRAKQPHVPYRNSKLTYLLQESLGGDSKTLMIVHVSPMERNAAESVASLHFAQRTRSVELGQATRKMEGDQELVDGTSPVNLKAARLNTPSKVMRRK